MTKISERKRKRLHSKTQATGWAFACPSAVPQGHADPPAPGRALAVRSTPQAPGNAGEKLGWDLVQQNEGKT